MENSILKLALLLLCIMQSPICRSEVKIDSCELRVLYATGPECVIKLKNNRGIVYKKYDSSKKGFLTASATEKILDGLYNIFIARKYPIIISKTKADNILYCDYPFLEITIYYGRKKINKLILVQPRDECDIYHYSEAFIKLWQIIDRVNVDFLNKYKGYNLNYSDLRNVPTFN